MKKNKSALIVAILLITVAVFAGCAGMGNRDMGDQDQIGTPQGFDDNQPGTINPDRNNFFGRNNQNNLNGRNNLDGQNNQNNMLGRTNSDSRRINDMNGMNQMSERIANELSAMEGIDRVEVVISRDTAIVGCQTRGNIDNVEAAIKKKVKELNPSINEVVVTDAPDMMDEIRNMSDQLMNGIESTTGNLDNKIKQLINRINTK